MSLGERVARLRKQRGWTQEHFASLIQVHNRHVSRLERDIMKPNASTLARIAEVLEVSLDELLDSSSTPQAPTIHNPVLLQTFRQAQDLDQEDQAMVVRMVQALLTKKKMEQALSWNRQSA